ncbi:response regulator transcription factor [Paenibacillus polygoni]|uniref:Heme response regulator HssR n=1 Tax=Paenibacillus polygoni TaxID=3050112 RepID=A0ABY8X215_9BACL|nr:response regulator transcription factor [Paenibacillus polygoni]WIV19063.1 response regulator transcription factor [Paenibacillus polygoni]
MPTILIVDDDSHIRELLNHLLKKEGFTTAEASNGIEALEVLEKIKVDLVILDIMMPGMDGWDLCKELADDYNSIPLLMLTAKGEITHKVRGFQLGTDDYLVKPFDPMELVVRVHALLKRYRVAASQQVEIGKLKLDRSTFECYDGEEAITLPLKEFELLFLLASYPGKTFPRDQLIERIWGYDYEGVERTVDVHIGRLRDRFKSDDHAFTIRTIRGLGYRFEVKR